MSHAFTIQLRDDNRNIVAEFDHYQSFHMIMRFNQVGAWTMKLPLETPVRDMITSKSGIRVKHEDDVVFSGPMNRWRKAWDADDQVYELSGYDDLEWIRRRVALPVVTGPPFTASVHDVRTGAAETVVKQYVDFNAGPSAQVVRQVPGLVVDSSSGIGSSVTGRARFNNLLDLISELALAGGDLGFDIRQSGTDLVFDVYQPTDKTATVIFSPELGNLNSYEHEEIAASANFVYIGGGGVGVDRVFQTGTDAASVTEYDRIEVFRDARDTSDSAELTQRINETLEEAAEQMSVSVDPVDIPSITYGVDYNLGDKVTVVVDGVAYGQIIREVDVKMDKDGAKITPKVTSPGSPVPVPGTALSGQVNEIKERIEDLERRL